MTKIFFSKNLGYPIKDFIKGTNVLSTLKFLKESQYWDETRLNEYRLNKLKFIIDYAKKNVPYYENQFGKSKLSSSDIKTLNDINKLPILTKEVLRKENTNLVSRNYNKRLIKKGKTGGTTGAPVIIFKDIHNRSFTWGSYYRWYEWMGINYYDPTVSLWGAKTVLRNSLKRRLESKITSLFQNEVVYDSFKMNEDELYRIYKNIIKQKPVLLKGYLSSMLNFAKFIHDKELDFTKLKAISSTTETLLPHNRTYLENIFKTSLFNQYGCGEVSAISYECSEHMGLHINQEHVICEVLDNNDNPIIEQSGRIIATDLDNLVMPFIRFENGDLATLTNEKCRCGVNQPLMKSIEGRTVDTVILNNGNKVHGVFFTDILYELNILTDEIQRFQIYQEIPGEIEFRIECSEPLSNEKHVKLRKRNGQIPEQG